MDAVLEKEFKKALEQIGIFLSEEQKKTFSLYLLFLKEEAKKYNVTGITEDDDIIEKHFWDSLASAKFINFSAYKNILDIGTGAGFPGVPLKIAFPHIALSLLESTVKKTLFLKNLLQKLSVEAEILNGRAETLAREHYRESFDFVVARAFGHFSETLECTLPFAKISGNVVLYQGKPYETAQAEPSIQMLGGKIKESYSFNLPFSRADRTLLVLEKIASTPEKFPRKPGIPHKRPLF